MATSLANHRRAGANDKHSAQLPFAAKNFKRDECSVGKTTGWPFEALWMRPKRSNLAMIFGVLLFSSVFSLLCLLLVFPQLSLLCLVRRSLLPGNKETAATWGLSPAPQRPVCALHCAPPNSPSHTQSFSWVQAPSETRTAGDANRPLSFQSRELPTSPAMSFFPSSHR